MRKRVGEGFDSLFFQFAGHIIHRNAEGLELGEDTARLVEVAGERDLGRAVIAEGVKRGRRDGVDGFGTDEGIHVEGVGVGGVFRARGGPQRTLDARAFEFETFPAMRGEDRAERLVGEFRVGDGGLAAQGRALGQFGVDLGIDARDEERGDRGDVVNRLSRGQAVFEAVKVGDHHFGVTLQREDERDVDVDSRGDDGAYGGDALGRGGDLDHQVGLADAFPELFCLCDGGLGIVGEIRADFETDESVAAVRFFVKRQEQVAGFLNIFDRELPEDLLRVPARPGEGNQRGIVIVRLGDGVVENGRVGRDAANFAALDHGFEFAVFEKFSLDVVVPEGLAEGGEFRDGIHE